MRQQFLQTLYSNALLRFDFLKLKWQWDVKQITARNITDNVVDLMANKINQLPENTSNMLQLAACIGNQFELPTLAIISQQDQNETLSVLWDAIKEGLIQPLDDNYKCFDTTSKSQFKFLHDRIQQAAYALIKKDQKQAIHLQIGRLLLTNTSREALDENVFDIVGQFNQSLELLNNQIKRVEIARLNLIAGQRAKAATAYEPAAQYLNIGIKLLAENAWQTQHDLIFELYQQSAECEYLQGNFDKSDQMLDTAFKHTKSDVEKGQLYLIRLTQKTAKAEYPDALQLGIEILKLFGINLPDSASQDEINQYLNREMVWYQQHWKDKKISELDNLPINNDPQKNRIMTILAAILDCSMNAAPHYLGILTISMVNYSIQHGNTQMSPFGYVWHAIVLATGFKDYDSAYQFGELALRVNEEKIHNANLTCKLLVMFASSVIHLKKPIQEKPNMLIKGYQAGLESGDRVYTAYAATHKVMGELTAGLNLLDVITNSEKELAIIKKVNNAPVYLLTRMVTSVALNLRGETESPGSLEHESFKESDFREICSDAGMFIIFLNFYHLKINYFFENDSQALKALFQVNLAIDAHIEGEEFHFYAALVLLRLYPTASESDQQKYNEMIDEHHTAIKKLANSCPVSFRAHDLLISAEKARVEAQVVEAMDLYDQAIEKAHESELVYNEAIAFELAAKFWLEKGKEKIAKTYMTDAHYFYEKWGATAKTTDLETKYPQLLTAQESKMSDSIIKPTILMTSGSTLTQTSKWLDLNSVTKAAQTLAGEIVLSKLLEKMMQIVIENAGAERGLLILKQENSQSEWVIEAEGAFEVDEVTVLQSLPIKNRLPSTIVNYVVRSREPVVLANAIQEGIYTEDSYIHQHQLKSILCSPILHQGQLIGLLYLENNLTEGAFTPARLKIVEVLSSQAAISLENALLYRTLEQKVEQRTKQLADANQEITLLNERLKKENMRMSAELDVAKQLQQMVLPKQEELQQIKGLDIAGFMTPADEVGGDYYEILNHDGQLKIGIGDVTGHGLESGVLMLMVQTTVRALLLAGIDNPKQFLNVVNQTIYHNARRMGTDKNLTLSLLDYQDGQLQVTGQHEEVLLVRQSGAIERIDTFELGFSVGVIDDIAEMVSQTHLELHEGDGIVLYTDGITEARNPKMELYEIERLCEVVSTNWHLSAKEIQQAVIADVRQFIGEQKVFDDITLLVLKQK
jgi:serine phosphatase RsbU (regulator of sigma subunit)/tetratricopeptide (TPR) repeat protein